jgi:hypothetical protein
MINDLLYNKEYVDVVLQIRLKLRIDMKALQEEARHSLMEGTLPYVSPIHNAHYRVEALAQCLLERHLISKRSARALQAFRCWEDKSRFWGVIYEASERIDWPDEFFLYAPLYYLVGGVCFDITEYQKKYEKTEFNDMTNDLLKMTKGGWEIEKSSIGSLTVDMEEYAYYHMYIRQAMFESNIFWWNYDWFPSSRDSFKKVTTKSFNDSIDSWKEFVGKTIQAGVYLNVTDLFLDDIEFYWHKIQMIKEQLGTYEALRIGRPKGIKTRHEVVREMTWGEIREYVRVNPRELNQLEREYVVQHGKDNPRLRGKAINNFYKQVIVHRDMRDMKLQIRKRGRPRKIEA